MRGGCGIAQFLWEFVTASEQSKGVEHAIDSEIVFDNYLECKIYIYSKDSY